MAKQDKRPVAGRVISQNEFSGFAKKMEQWGKELPDSERAILALLLERARRRSLRQYDGLDVAMATKNVSDFLEPYLRGIYFLPEEDGGSPDGGWVAWGMKLDRTTRAPRK